MGRIITTLVLFISLVVLPWYLAAMGIIFAMLYFSTYYEGLALGLFFDALYGVPLSYLWGLSFLGTLIFSTAFLVVEYMKPRLRCYF